MKLTDSGLIEMTDSGIYCRRGDFYIDPWRPVSRAIITHGHSDHSRWGMKNYLCSKTSVPILRHRLGSDINVNGQEWGQVLSMDGVKISLHPAGHILGSAQIRMEFEGEVAVVTGDYKTDPDPTCEPFETLKCHTLVSECTFGLPIYHWPDEVVLKQQINDWWRRNQAEGKCSLLMGYALGKSQRALATLDASMGPIVVHGAVHPLNEIYRQEGIQLPETRLVSELEKDFDWSQAMVIAPPSAAGTPWVRRFGDHSTAFLSGWMAVRGARRRRAVDRGFVMSDHVDWPSLLTAIRQSECERVWLTHGYTQSVTKFLQEQGMDARVLTTIWEGEMDGNSEEVPAE